MAAPPNGLLFGFYRALVIDPDDPKQTGRVKVRIPDVMTNKSTCGEYCDHGIWARPGNLQLGGRNVRDTLGPRCFYKDALYQGQCLIPPKGSHVFIFFEKGDPNRPFYYGAADYGQNKILAEHRTGGKQYLKWTPMKTHEGRTMIFSDDPFDARVEITGKKRTMHNPPDGDFESVYKIDGNQTIFMIEERPGHEKVMLKDYHGNYMKMIQNDGGRQDQFHLWMKDDIHIETLKNIYITAHENIHIKAFQDIYVTALQNMYIKVVQHFSEMAHLIDRYSETNDNMRATLTINEMAGVDISMSANSNIKEMAGAVCSRAAGSNIADGAGGSMSISAAGTMSVVGSGGTMVDGPTTTINNGNAIIPPLKGVEEAVPSPEATDANPDKERYQEVPDPPKPDPVEDKNEIWKCNKFWHPWKPKVESGVSQCINAKVEATGGCGKGPTGPDPSPVSSSGLNGGGGGGGSGGGANGSSSAGQNVSGSGGQDQQTNSPNSSSNPNSGSGTKINIENESTTILNNSPVLNVDGGYVPQVGSDAFDTVIKTTMDSITTTIDIVDKGIEYITDHIETQTHDGFDNSLPVVYTSGVLSRCDDLNARFKLDVECLEFNKMIDYTFYKILVNKHYNPRVSQPVTSDDLYNYMFDCLNNNVQGMVNTYHEYLDDYKNNTQNIDKTIFYNYKQKLTESFNETLNDVFDGLKRQPFYSPIMDNICDQKESYFKGINQYLQSDFVEDTYRDIYNNINPQTVSTCKQKMTDRYSGPNNHLKDIIKNYCDKKHIDCNILAESIAASLNNVDTNYDMEFNLYQANQHYPHDDKSVLGQKIHESICNISNQYFNDTLQNVTEDIDVHVGDFDSEIIHDNDPIEHTKEKFDDNLDDPTKPIKSDVFDPENYNPVHVEPTYMDKPPEEDYVPLVTPKGIQDIITTTILDNIPDDDDTEDMEQDILDVLENQPIDIDVVDVPDVSTKVGDIIDRIQHDPETYKTIVDTNDFDFDITVEDVKNDYKDPDFKDKVIDKFKDTLDNVIKRWIEESDDGVYDIESVVDPNPDKTPEYYDNLPDTKREICDKILDKVIYDVVKIDNELKNAVGDYFDKDVPSQNEVNDIVNNVKDFVEDKTDDIINDIRDGEDPKEKLEELEEIRQGGLPPELIPPKDETSLNEVMKDILDLCDDITKGLDDVSEYKDIILKTVEDEFDTLDPIKRYESQNYAIVDAIINDVADTISTETTEKIKDDINDKLDKLIEILDTTKDPVDINNAFNDIITTFESTIKDFDNLELLDPKDIEDIAKNNIKDNIPTKKDLETVVVDCVDTVCKGVFGIIKDKINENVILTNGNTDDEFNPNVDLTKVYTIPGLDAPEECGNKNESTDGCNCPPNKELYGGCGCMYTYMLFLKDEYYDTIIPITLNDKMNTIGLDLNPNMDNFNDPNYLIHDKDIIDDYNELMRYYCGETDHIKSDNKYYQRLNDFMLACEAHDLTVVVNLLDFECKSYHLLNNIDEKDRYTVIMWEEGSFKRYLKDILKHITTKQLDDGDTVKRDCKIVFNIGYGAYPNDADPELEKYSMYPTCKFVRDMVMFMSYRCDFSSNYMAITHNSNQDLYYYNPYSEFKSYSDQLKHQLQNYEVEFLNAENEHCVTYEEGEISGGYFKYITDIGNTYSYPIAYTNNIIGNIPDGMSITPNIMNKAYLPLVRKAIRYMTCGHTGKKNYFNHKDINFDDDDDSEG